MRKRSTSSGGCHSSTAEQPRLSAPNETPGESATGGGLTRRRHLSFLLRWPQRRRAFLSGTGSDRHAREPCAEGAGGQHRLEWGPNHRFHRGSNADRGSTTLATLACAPERPERRRKVIPGQQDGLIHQRLVWFGPPCSAMKLPVCPIASWPQPPSCVSLGFSADCRALCRAPRVSAHG
jgi:hypothetical protein